ncbi:hypothetical protein [Bowdeniella nasicola]|uniref:hypothetical protein n=1 Tax=Bowdeniella nasicola TaxID=208480 RepID=UPI0011600672|nr:hypothetical protein [Bowdeniella nasicola]
MSFLVDLALDLVGDAFISKPSQRKRRMRKLKACATDVTRGDLPALKPETPATGAIQPGSIAWAKLPTIEPVVVLALSDGLYCGAGRPRDAGGDPAGAPGQIRCPEKPQRGRYLSPEEAARRSAL